MAANKITVRGTIDGEVYAYEVDLTKPPYNRLGDGEQLARELLAKEIAHAYKAITGSEGQPEDTSYETT